MHDVNSPKSPSSESLASSLSGEDDDDDNNNEDSHVVYSASMDVFAIETFSLNQFQETWKHGRPLIVTGICKQMTLPWTPEFFIDEFPKTTIYVEDSDSPATQLVYAKDFFLAMGKYKGRKHAWKMNVCTLK